MELLNRVHLILICLIAASSGSLVEGEHPAVALNRELHQKDGFISGCNVVLVGFQGEPDIIQTISGSVTLVEKGLSESQTEVLADFFHMHFDCISLWIDYKRVSVAQINMTLLGNMVRKVTEKDEILIVDSLKDVEQLGFNHPTYILEKKSKDHFLLFLACPNHSFLQPLAIWTRSSGFTSSLDFHLVKCPHIFRDRHLRISCRGLPPFNIWKPNGEIYGVDVDLVDILSRKLGFSYILTTENVMGSRIANSNNEWLGVVGAVKNGTATLGIGNPALDPDRYSAVDYSVMLYTIDTNFVAAHPKPNPPYENLLNPFTVYSWVAISIALIVVTLTLGWVTRFTSHHLASAKAPSRNTMLHAYMLPFQSLMEQSVDDSFMASRATRIIIGFWYIFVFFILSGYFCNLRAFLVSMEFETPIDRAEDIINLQKNFFLPLGTSLETSVVTSPLRVHQQLKAISQGFYLENGWLTSEVEKSLLQSQGAIIFPKEPVQMTYNKFEKEFGYQPFRISKEVAFEYHAGFLIPKYAPWKPSVDQILLTLVEMGFIQRLKRTYYPLGVMFDQGDKKRNQSIIGPLQFQHFYAGFICIGAGLLLALMSFLFEFRGEIAHGWRNVIAYIK